MSSEDVTEKRKRFKVRTNVNVQSIHLIGVPASIISSPNQGCPSALTVVAKRRRPRVTCMVSFTPLEYILTFNQDDQSHFQVALEQWRQLNLASAFLQFANKSEPLSASLPLLLHNWEAVVDLWIGATNEADLESKQPLLE
jgi:hypothetical protein